MGNNRSVLRFEKYIVKSISFEINELCMDLDKEIELKFDFDTETSINGNKLEIELRADVFKQALKNKYPFEMQVILKGFFSMDSDEPTVNVNMFEKNAIAILFPYLRSIVSTYTVNANVPPVLLPAMNINEYIRRKYQNGEEQA